MTVGHHLEYKLINGVWKEDILKGEKINKLITRSILIAAESYGADKIEVIHNDDETIIKMDWIN